MGTYLSTPVVDKCEETGTDLNGHPGCAKSSRPVNWGVVDMQGWRKSMEDAHVARTNVRPPALPPGVARGDPTEGTCSGGDPSNSSGSSSSDDDPAVSSTPSDEPGQIASVANDADQEPAKVFAVFDGHGGPEVARFCQLYLVDVLTSQKEWNNATLVEQGASTTEEVDGAADASMSNGEPRPSALGSTAPNIGKALIESFHALDRMIDDPSRRDELTLLRSEKPQPGQYKSVTEGGGRPIPSKGGDNTPCLADEAESEEDDDATDDGAEENGDSVQCAEEEKKECTEAGNSGNNTAEEPSSSSSSSSSPDADTEKKDKEAGKDTPALIEESKDSTKEDKEVGSSEGSSEGDTDNASTDSDSTASVGGGDSIVNDGLDDDDVDDDNEDGEGDGVISTADAVALFQKLLTMSGSSGTVEVEVEEGEDEDSNEADGEASKPVAVVSDDGSGTPSQPAATTIGPNAAQPTRIQNGRQVCNLPDHPIHAGCTSVVAVLVGNTVTVANAGDSRAVLCRAGGVTEALSFDHKPLQDRERNRIAAAGGFVNQFGRVNGNLNLSRSIGDMKYKQVPGIPPSGQMITAEPDIVQVTLNPADEFLILGCDGIWDCLTNEEAVKYVRDRINDKTPVEIGREMLDEIISDDPRASQGIGGDNMTVMIIDLLPKSRSYFE